MGCGVEWGWVVSRTEIKQRDGDKMIRVVVETSEAVVSFDDILEAVKVEPDDCSEAPWESCDGYEHRVIDDETGGDAVGSFFDRHEGRRKRVVTDEFENWGSALRGASKQVQFEAHAEEVKRTIEQLARWYSSGWGVWCVSCRFKGYTDSCCGFYDDDGDSEYMRENVREIAGNVARDMVKDGYTVEGWEERPYDPNGWRKSQIRERLKASVKRVELASIMEPGELRD